MTVRVRRSFAAKRRKVRAQGGRCDWCGYDNCRSTACAIALADFEQADLVCPSCWPTPCGCRKEDG